MSESERPDRLQRPPDHRRGHPRARRPVDAPLRASDPQPDPAPDRRARRRTTRCGSRASARSSGSTELARHSGDPRAGPVPPPTEAPRRCAASARSALLRRARPGRSVAATRAASSDAGYLDLLERDLESTGPTQDLMTTRLVPAIYERYWRPALGRMVKGVTGPGMAEELRIARLLLGLGDGRHRARRRLRPGQLHARVRAHGRRDRASWSASTPRRRCSTAASTELRRADVRQPGPDPRRRDRAAVPRRESSTASAASRPCTCSRTRSPRSTRCGACSGPAAGSR